jgi:hypothetical protein
MCGGLIFKKEGIPINCLNKRTGKADFKFRFNMSPEKTFVWNPPHFYS